MSIIALTFQGLLRHAGDYPAHILHRSLPFGPRTFSSVVPPHEREQHDEQAVPTWPREYLPIPTAAEDRPAVFISRAPIRLKTRPPLPPRCTVTVLVVDIRGLVEVAPLHTQPMVHLRGTVISAKALRL